MVINPTFAIKTASGNGLSTQIIADIDHNNNQIKQNKQHKIQFNFPHYDTATTDTEQFR